MITSKDNKHIKNLIALQTKAKERRNQGAFVTEGSKMVEETPTELLKEIYVSESFLAKEADKYHQITDALSDQIAKGEILLETLPDALFKMVSDTQTPQGILAVVRKPVYLLEELLKADCPMFLILEDIQDPGNLGTMMRTGEGAGVTAVIMSKNTVDLFNPKTIRSTMGSIYRVPFVVAENLPDTIAQLKAAGVSLYAAHLKGENSYDGYDYTKPTGFLIGNEGNGLSKEIADLADIYIRIPMEGKLESLNAAISAGLLMYECHRQR